MIVWFGTGLLGANFVRALRRRGEAVQVWNRTPEKARVLESLGVQVFSEPAEAARGASRIHITLSDDAAVDQVLERAWPGFGPDVIVVDHTTTSPAGTAARAKRWAERGVTFLHAPVFMAPSNALESTGLMLASGEKALFDTLLPELAKMTGKVKYLGIEPERAASFKLFGNLLLMLMTTGVVEVLKLAKATGINAEDVPPLFELFNPGAMVGPRFRRIMDADYSHPSWELEMARKDARLMIDAANAGGVPLAVLPALAAEMDRWIEAGHAHDDWTVIAKDAL